LLDKRGEGGGGGEEGGKDGGGMKIEFKLWE
jgi:hypothetical protein